MARPRLLVDLSPLRQFPQYRVLWSGYLITTLGNQLTVVAVPYQIYRITHSSLDVGLVSLVQIVPLLAGSLIGGAVADSFDRRRLLMVSQLLLASTSLGLALNASSARPALWPLFVCSAFQAGFSGVDSPTRSALVVSLVDRESLVGANALWQVLFQFGQIGGPAVAGLLLGRLGVGPVYWIDLATFTVSLVSLVRLRTVRVERPDGGRELGFAAMVGGIRFLRGHRVLQAIFLADLNAMIFGMPRALFPALGLTHFHGGAGTVGLLYAAPGVGAFAGAVLTGWVARVRRQGRAVLVAIGVWGGAIALFGVVPELAVALVLLGVAGAADVVSAVFRATILQFEAPHELLGRLQAVQTAVVTGGPRLGDLESGVVASLAGTEVSVVSGGLLCLLGVVLLARLIPRFAGLELASTRAGRAAGSTEAGGSGVGGTGVEG
ncbi:MAG TPA: MFS transporter [Acidimicrobiales bacterium]|nr:MFS transporter [Acidimicrobiales bacterium]